MGPAWTLFCLIDKAASTPDSEGKSSSGSNGTNEPELLDRASGIHSLGGVLAVPVHTDAGVSCKGLVVGGKATVLVVGNGGGVLGESEGVVLKEGVDGTAGQARCGAGVGLQAVFQIGVVEAVGELRPAAAAVLEGAAATMEEDLATGGGGGPRGCDALQAAADLGPDGSTLSSSSSRRSSGAESAKEAAAAGAGAQSMATAKHVLHADPCKSSDVVSPAAAADTAVLEAVAGVAPLSGAVKPPAGAFMSTIEQPVATMANGGFEKLGEAAVGGCGLGTVTGVPASSGALRKASNVKAPTTATEIAAAGGAAVLPAAAAGGAVPAAAAVVPVAPAGAIRPAAAVAVTPAETAAAGAGTVPAIFIGSSKTCALGADNHQRVDTGGNGPCGKVRVQEQRHLNGQGGEGAGQVGSKGVAASRIGLQSSTVEGMKGARQEEAACRGEQGVCLGGNKGEFAEGRTGATESVIATAAAAAAHGSQSSTRGESHTAPSGKQQQRAVSSGRRVMGLTGAAGTGGGGFTAVAGAEGGKRPKAAGVEMHAAATAVEVAAGASGLPAGPAVQEASLVTAARAREPEEAAAPGAAVAVAAGSPVAAAAAEASQGAAGAATKRVTYFEGHKLHKQYYPHDRHRRSSTHNMTWDDWISTTASASSTPRATFTSRASRRSSHASTATTMATRCCSMGLEDEEEDCLASLGSLVVPGVHPKSGGCTPREHQQQFGQEDGEQGVLAGAMIGTGPIEVAAAAGGCGGGSRLRWSVPTGLTLPSDKQQDDPRQSTAQQQQNQQQQQGRYNGSASQEMEAFGGSLEDLISPARSSANMLKTLGLSRELLLSQLEQHHHHQQQQQGMELVARPTGSVFSALAFPATYDELISPARSSANLLETLRVPRDLLLAPSSSNAAPAQPPQQKNSIVFSTMNDTESGSFESSLDDLIAPARSCPNLLKILGLSEELLLSPRGPQGGGCREQIGSSCGGGEQAQGEDLVTYQLGSSTSGRFKPWLMSNSQLQARGRSAAAVTSVADTRHGGSCSEPGAQSTVCLADAWGTADLEDAIEMSSQSFSQRVATWDSSSSSSCGRAGFTSSSASGSSSLQIGPAAVAAVATERCLAAAACGDRTGIEEFQYQYNSQQGREMARGNTRGLDRPLAGTVVEEGSRSSAGPHFKAESTSSFMKIAVGSKASPSSCTPPAPAIKGILRSKSGGGGLNEGCCLPASSGTIRAMTARGTGGRATASTAGASSEGIGIGSRSRPSMAAASEGGPLTPRKVLWGEQRQESYPPSHAVPGKIANGLQIGATLKSNGSAQVAGSEVGVASGKPGQLQHQQQYYSPPVGVLSDDLQLPVARVKSLSSRQ